MVAFPIVCDEHPAMSASQPGAASLPAFLTSRLVGEKGYKQDLHASIRGSGHQEGVVSGREWSGLVQGELTFGSFLYRLCLHQPTIICSPALLNMGATSHM